MPPDRQGVVVKEVKLMGHLTLRRNPENEEMLNTVSSIFGFSLPLELLTSTSKGDFCRSLVSAG
ncbi:hypothetical protein P4S64_16010 [Vibrio sp. M60_M31a]